MKDEVREFLSNNGKIGGSSKSAKKSEASRRNIVKAQLKAQAMWKRLKELDNDKASD